ncbi:MULTISPECIES: recombinase family protein [unclassified Streptomyces]|uniref:recombinase family protein n=1 Tax=unclassified Streptomyces TaxID=2593676 RepID=UPI003D8D24DA
MPGTSPSTLSAGKPTLPALSVVMTNPQVSTVDNARRQSTSVNGPTDGFRFRHMVIGHPRVSTADNPDRQIDALLRHGVDRDHIHVDKASGAKASRPQLDLISNCSVRATR